MWGDYSLGDIRGPPLPDMSGHLEALLNNLRWERWVLDIAAHSRSTLPAVLEHAESVQNK